MFRFLLPISLLALLIVPCIAQDAEYKPPRKWTFGSMGVAMRDNLEVYQGGARNEAGEIVIKEKDRLQKWGGKELKTLDDFCVQLYATKPGDIIEVEISRPIEGKEERETLTVKIKLADPKVAYKELYTHLDKRKRTYDWRNNEAVTKGGPLREKLWPRIQKHKLEGHWDNLIAAQERELDLWDSYENLSSTDLLLSDPLAAHQWMTGTTDAMREGNDGQDPMGVGVQVCLSRLLDATATDWKAPELPKLDTADWKSWTARADALLELIRVIDMPADWARVHDAVDYFELRSRDDPEFFWTPRAIDYMRELKIDSVSRLRAIPFVLDELKKMAEACWAEHLKGNDFPEADLWAPLAEFVQGDFACFQTGFGMVAVGGKEANVWTGVQRQQTISPILIVDLGGDDQYVNCATTKYYPEVSIVIDLGGNDHYRSTQRWSTACGMLGTAIIDDHNGNDTYECGDWGIGSAFGGIGLLIDREGNDRYLGGTNSIGCAAYGIGGVIDLEGNDIYDGHSLSIGVGQPGGVGFVLDHSGDDRYRCTGETPSSYGTEGEWFGGGIGCGFGWRTVACGGIGLVVDVKGNDIYDAGEFGLGCGYFMAIGAVRDMDGDDIYHSSRYGLAAAAHAAVGVFMDDKGNDVYEGKTAASIGGTWDIVTGYFYDGAGDDNYRCDGLGLGACAQNGFGIFWDAGGNDNYRGGPSTIGNAGGAEYGGGRLAKNFGIFIDSGGGKDNYPRDDRKNGSELVDQQYAIFWDE